MITTATNPLALIGEKKMFNKNPLGRSKSKETEDNAEQKKKGGRANGKLGILGNPSSIMEKSSRGRLCRAFGGPLGTAPQNPPRYGEYVPPVPQPIQQKPAMYKKGGDADLKTHGMDTPKHKKALAEMKEEAKKKGGLTSNHVQKIAEKHGIDDEREHHLLGKLVKGAVKGVAKTVGGKYYKAAKAGVKAVKAGYSAAKSSLKGKKEDNDGDDAEKKANGGVVGGSHGRLNILKLTKTEVR